ncbi:hypothetical protein C6495_14460 [Candidatus Poribacteria bacterium]|nr:MAG: hypothetical protein C6495_14460 [Candidatus Poribacteria bacterium]
MRASQFLTLFLNVLLVGFVLSLTSCGGSNLNNPVAESDTTAVTTEATDADDIVELAVAEDAADVEQGAELNVKVTVTKKTVEPGEDVELTASVKGVKGTSVTLNWLNVTGHGTLSATTENPVTWTAPSTLDGANVQVEVIQLVVTVITEVVSVGASGIDTDTQILSETKTILLSVKDN